MIEKKKMFPKHSIALALTERVQLVFVVLVALCVADELVELGLRREVAGHCFWIVRVVGETKRAGVRAGAKSRRRSRSLFEK